MIEKKTLNAIIEYYQRNIGKHFPNQRLGIADRFLFNQAIIEISYKFSKFNKGKPIMTKPMEQVEGIMKGYGLHFNIIGD